MVCFSLFGISYSELTNMYTSENNWYKWTYGDLPEFSRQPNNLEFKTIFSSTTNTVGSFKRELINAAFSSMEHCNGRPTILFSGGLDSEIMLRSFLAVRSNPEVIIVRYENDYNLYDVSHAIVICETMQVKYKIIDFSLKKFYETEALKYAELSQIDRPRALPYCKILEMVDGFPIMGASDLTPYRTDTDYSKKGTWMIRCWEHDIGWSKFLRQINKPGIAEWFKWTPGLVVSYMQTQWFQDLINDKFTGKMGANSTKIYGYREAYPMLINRQKKTGFEDIDILANEVEKEIQVRFNGLPYRNHCDRSVQDLMTQIVN